MAGFPGILTRLGLGPIFKNRSRIRNAEYAMSAEQANLFLWQLAGMNGTGPRARIICTVSGSVITPTFKWLSWDPNGSLPMNTITMGYTSTGDYTWAFASSSYPDQSGASVPLAFTFAECVSRQPSRVATALVLGTGYTGTITGINTSSGAAADMDTFQLKLY